MKRLIRKANKLFYHGTTFANAEKILQQGSIKPNDQTGNIMHNTQQGNAIFLTDSIIDAIGYSRVSNASSANELGVVFHIELDSNDVNSLVPGDDVIGDIDSRLKVLEELGLIESADSYSSYEARQVVEQYSEQLTQYIKDNYNWQQSLDIMSEVAYQGEIPLNKIYLMEVYKNSSTSYQSEVIDLNSLHELSESLLEE